MADKDFRIKNGAYVNGAVTINSTSISFGNTVLANNYLAIGNSTVNTVANSSGIYVNNVQLTSGNPGGANTQIQFNDSGVFNAISGLTFNKTTNTLFIANTANVATINATTNILVGNSTINVTTNSSFIQVANSTATANMQLSGFIVGIATQNSTAFSVGANVIINSSTVFVGNSTVNVVVNSSALSISGVVPTFPVASANIGYLGIPQNSKSANYTTILSDAGKHILHPAADTNARSFTIDSNANVAYEIGTVITFVNQTSQVLSIAITSDTLTLGGTTTNGTRSLAQNGVAAAIKVGTTSWIITGTGLT